MTTPIVPTVTDELIAELEAAANACESWYVEKDLGITLDLVSDEDNRFVLAASPATILALLAHIADLKQQLAAASVDAGRYRFLRNESVNADSDTVMAAKIDGAGDQISNWFFGAGLDAAIDAARDIAAMDIGSCD